MFRRNAKSVPITVNVKPEDPDNIELGRNWLPDRHKHLSTSILACIPMFNGNKKRFAKVLVNAGPVHGNADSRDFPFCKEISNRISNILEHSFGPGEITCRIRGDNAALIDLTANVKDIYFEIYKNLRREDNFRISDDIILEFKIKYLDEALLALGSDIPQNNPPLPDSQLQFEKHLSDDFTLTTFCPVFFSYRGEKRRALMTKLNGIGATFNLPVHDCAFTLHKGHEMEYKIKTPCGVSKCLARVAYSGNNHESYSWTVAFTMLSRNADDPLRCMIDSPF